MQLFDLPWISHEGGNIFSLDLHPNGKKMATAGQDGGGAGLLVIWDIDFVNSLSSDSTSPSNCNFNPMARIPHTSTINCVRWSKQSDSKKLVCAGDDPVLCVYECVGVYSSLGSIGQMDSSKSNVANRNVESYRCIYKLYGHSLDVLHLDWSPDGKYLASCSLDNTIIIWNAQKLPEKVTILRESNGGHNRGVKGLAWDPIGRFLSTQAEDNSLKIWQTDSWTCVRTFTEPFCESAISTLFCRMDWSPDGSHLVAPCALNNGGPTAKIFVRKDWSHTRDLVGFRKAVSCVRSNPHCFQRTNSSSTHSTVSCFAVGCRDRSVSVWLIPNFARPIIVMEKLFKDTIVDLSWSKLTLAACSRDGVVRILNFTDNEIGHLLSAHETASILERLYGLHPSYCSTSLRDIHSRGGEAMAASPDFGYSSISDVLLTKRAKETIVTEEQLSRTLLNREPPRKRISTEQLQRFSLKCKRHKLGDKDNKSSNNSFLKSNLDAHNQLERDDLISISRPRVDNRLYEKKDAETEEGDTTKALFELPERRRLLIAVMDEEKEKFTLELINDYQLKSCSDSTIWARLIAYSGEGEGQKHPRWTFFYPRLVSILTANRKWTAITTFDAHLLVLSTQTGRHLFDICVDEPLAIVHLDGEADLCLSIGMTGNLSVWDIPNRRRLVHKSINSFFRHPNQQLITANALKLPGSTEEQATAQLQLSDLNSFVYSHKLDAWKKNSSFMDFLNAANLPTNITSLLIQLQHDEQKEL